MSAPDPEDWMRDYAAHGPEFAGRRYETHTFYHNMRIKTASIKAIVIGVACLEAYVNELCVLVPSLVGLEHGSIRGRYQQVSEILSGGRFDARKEPFKSFHHLVELRNRIVHFNLRSEWSPEALEDEGMTQWVRQTTVGMILSINSMVRNPDICLDPYELAYLTNEQWQKLD